MTDKIFHMVFEQPLRTTATDTIAMHEVLGKAKFIHGKELFNGMSFLRVAAETTPEQVSAHIQTAFPARKLSIGLTDLSQRTGWPRRLEALFSGCVPGTAVLVVTPSIEPDPLATFVGIDTILTQFRKVCDAILAARRSNVLLGTKIEPGFQNILLIGPFGVGKTALAQAFAIDLKRRGVVARESPSIFMAAKDAVGDASGKSDIILRDKLAEAEDGVLVIDELDALTHVYSYGTSALKTLNEHMGNRSNKPIIIATCNGNGKVAIMAAEGGLGRRFAHKFHQTGCNDDQLLDIFRGKIATQGLHFTDRSIEQTVRDQLRVLRSAKGAEFGNGGEIDNLIDAINVERMLRVAPLMESAGTTPLPDKMRHALRQIIPADMPVYDVQLESYVAAPPVRDGAMSARVRSESVVVAFAGPKAVK